MVIWCSLYWDTFKTLKLMCWVFFFAFSSYVSHRIHVWYIFTYSTFTVKSTECSWIYQTLSVWVRIFLFPHLPTTECAKFTRPQWISHPVFPVQTPTESQVMCMARARKLSVCTPKSGDVENRNEVTDKKIMKKINHQPNLGIYIYIPYMDLIGAGIGE